MRHTRSLLLALSLAVAGLSSTHARATSVVTGASRDNTIFAEFDTLSNGAGQTFFAGRNGLGDLRRGLIKFDLAGLVPANATVDSVVLRLRLSMTLPGSRLVSLYRLLADWGEGTSDAESGEGAGAPATPGDATWNQRFFGASLSWLNPGGDYAASASATRPVGALGVYAWRSTGMTADVASWVQNPSSNLGWMVLGDESAVAGAKRFDSRQATTAANRPSLTIFYTEVPTAAGPLSPRVQLFPVHPNPFNPAASIRYQLPAAQRVRIAVYDISGRIVRVLVDGVVAAGDNETVWHGDDNHGVRVASGIYVLKLTTTDTAPQTEKMVLLK
jgi:hypothetical protein